MKTLYELRRLASTDIQSVAQTCATLSNGDASTYLDLIVIGIHTLREGAPPVEVGEGRTAYVVADDLPSKSGDLVTNYFTEESTFRTTWVDDRTYAKRFISQQQAERAARRLGRRCRVETIEEAKDG